MEFLDMEKFTSILCLFVCSNFPGGWWNPKLYHLYRVYGAVHDLWGNLTPIGTARHSWQSTDRRIEKIEIPSRSPFRNWLILNGERDGIFIFFFFGPVDCHECSRGWGDGGARDCERGPQRRRGVEKPSVFLSRFWIYQYSYILYICRLTPILSHILR